ncbi:MAG TPA: CoA pyrophosphatase [Bacteroidales bacterium]|nr:CoA pyrophosphatase [Bacteroidales bacterium]HSA44712.1 CoA pyrophosphatase [Bacteroidales bacterium]
MIFRELIPYLRSRMQEALPGEAAQRKMLSSGRFPHWPIPEAYKKSGVLILLYPWQGEAMTLLIRRPEYDGVHSGQIAFPGGKMEEGDENITATALRESQEEVGLNPDKVRILGALTPLYVPPSGYLVHPVIACLEKKPVFRPDPSEVAGIIEIPLKVFFRHETLCEKTVRVKDWSSSVPCYFIDQQIIWGATAMIISEFLELIRPFYEARSGIRV